MRRVSRMAFSSLTIAFTLSKSSWFLGFSSRCSWITSSKKSFFYWLERMKGKGNKSKACKKEKDKEKVSVGLVQ
jgi:hypothetical protein